MSVGIVVVSHSAKIAEGVVDVAGQMAPDVRLCAAGGREGSGGSGDGIGTSFERVQAALAAAQDGSGVVVLCDLGSAVLTVETALDFLDDEARESVLLVDAPLVEGAVAAAVAAQIGGDLRAVAAAAGSATGTSGAGQDAARELPADRSPAQPSPADGSPARQRTAGAAPAARGAEEHNTAEGRAVLINADGLHARPAAEFVRAASAFDAAITINGVDAASLLGVLALGLTSGSEAVVRATGADARSAVDTLLTLLGGGFGETRALDVGSS